MAKHTPLYDAHVGLGAKMVEFADWDMPVQYMGIKDEHLAVRNAAGLFDVSHMGEIEITGPGALALVQHISTNDASTMIDGKAQYSLMLNERGTVVDDVIIYRFTQERFIIVVNASNIEKDFQWIRKHANNNVAVTNRSDDYALIAFQGPKAPEVLQGLTEIDLPSIKRYHFSSGMVAGIKDVIFARTGYTGEDGFELFCDPSDAPALWIALLNAGKSLGVKPAGLAARDTLRIEMKYSLYDHEISEETNPYEAGLGWVVKMGDENNFYGKDVLVEIKKQGIKRRLVGFTMIDRAIPRQGYSIVKDGNTVGEVTSGTMSPSLDIPIGIGFVPPDMRAVGTRFHIDIRGKLREAEVVETPFYKTVASSS